MKKFITILFLGAFTMPAFAYAPSIAPVINVHDMQMIKEQQFRREEINDYNDVKQIVSVENKNVLISYNCQVNNTVGSSTISNFTVSCNLSS